MSQLLFYNDARQIGGHEKLMIEAIISLSTKHSVAVIVSDYNTELCRILQKISGVEVNMIHYASNSRQIIRNFFSLKTFFLLYNQIRRMSPELIVSVQGTIDTSFLAILVGRFLKIKTISYLPFAFKLARVSKHPQIGWLKDRIQYLYYSAPNGYITLNEAVKRQIQERFSKKKVLIVHNGLKYDRYTSYSPKEMRQKYELPEKLFLFGIVGRFEYWHKGLDFFLNFLDRYHSELPANIGFVFVGDGSDKELLLQQVERYKNVYVIPWSQNISEIYALINALILPSRFEGVPLTILEALYLGCPVIASDIDGVRDLLSSEHLFTFGCYDQLLNRLLGIWNKRIGASYLDRNLYSMTCFCREFSKAIDFYCNDFKN
ncbi:glycosyltransferase [Bacteroides sp.]|uniref:glycosyltransferase n=1 Tax=Bacteroides sp. TaxID=29523 RepID=UPI00263139D8|nr:glycosyltransferase [Bacteroides sp.]MDD3037275.1 glycosyltransferase [Bacteroides sp.]